MLREPSNSNIFLYSSEIPPFGSLGYLGEAQCSFWFSEQVLGVHHVLQSFSWVTLLPNSNREAFLTLIKMTVLLTNVTKSFNNWGEEHMHFCFLCFEFHFGPLCKSFGPHIRKPLASPPLLSKNWEIYQTDIKKNFFWELISDSHLNKPIGFHLKKKKRRTRKEKDMTQLNHILTSKKDRKKENHHDFNEGRAEARWSGVAYLSQGNYNKG